MANRLYKRAVDFVKKEILQDYRVKIWRGKIPADADGVCYKEDNGSFLIKVAGKLPEYYAVDVLLHEAAHVLSWDKDDDDHGLNWGKAYSKVYRKFITDFTREEKEE